MKTIEQVMAGVTDNGQWSQADFLPFEFSRSDAAYAERACSTWPELVEALEACLGLTYHSTAAETCRVHEQARAELAKALRD